MIPGLLGRSKDSLISQSCASDQWQERMCHTNFADYNITNAVKHDTLRHEKPKEIK